MISGIDHVGIAVKSIDEARKFWVDTLGLRLTRIEDVPEQKVRVAILQAGETTIELLEPTSPDSPVQRFLEKRGEGLHHLTLDVPNSKEKIAELKQQGVKVVDEREFGPDSYEAFISPRSSHGVLIQIGSGFPTLARAAEWFKR